MAKENIKKFFEEVSKNEDLQKQLETAAKAKSAEEQAPLIAEIASKAGFAFTAEELLDGISPSDKKLDMNELAAVAGGGGTCFLIGWGQGKATTYYDECVTEAVGMGACKFIGVGMGKWQ